MVAFICQGCLDRLQVRTGTWLGHANRQDHFSCSAFWQVFFLLLFRSKGVDVTGDHIVMQAKGKTGFTDSGYFLDHNDGITKIFQANAARIHNHEDQLVGVVTVIRDVTKVKEADQIKTELVSMVAHELKSPLTSIYGFSELLLDAKLKDPKAEEYAKVILAESTRLTDLVNKFLDISRLEAGRTEIRLNPFNIQQVIAKIVDIYKAQADKKHIRVIQEAVDKADL